MTLVGKRQNREKGTPNVKYLSYMTHRNLCEYIVYLANSNMEVNQLFGGNLHTSKLVSCSGEI